jgi:hypothetical protein
LWGWAKTVQNTDGIYNKYLLAKEVSELTVWHVAEMACNVELLDKLWEWDKKQHSG